MALELPKFGSKNKKESGGAPKVDVAMKIVEFFDKNPIMKILIPVVLFVILCGVIVFIVLGDGILTDDVDVGSDTLQSSDYVGVYDGNNNIITDKEIVELIENDPLSPDILANAVYTGCVTGSSGLKTANVQIGDTGDSLVLYLGDTIGDSDWEVIEINPDYIIVEAGEVQRKLEIK